MQIEELTPELAGDDQPGEDYQAKAGRLTAARSRAEEIMLPQQILLAPEPQTSEDPEDSEPPPASPALPLVVDRSHPAVGGGERRTDGTGAGQLAAPRFRPPARTTWRRPGPSPASAPTWPR